MEIEFEWDEKKAENFINEPFDDDERELMEAVENGNFRMIPREETEAFFKVSHKGNERKMCSYRLPVWMIEGLKKNAKKKNAKYHQYVYDVLAAAAM